MVSLFTITRTIGCFVNGLSGDGRSLIVQCRHEANRYEFDHGCEILLQFASRLADIMQLNTQSWNAIERRSLHPLRN